MAKASRTSVKTLTINKSRDFIVDKMTKPCEEGDHSKCTGWAVLRKEVSSVNANYFLRCTCACHRKKQQKPMLKKRKQPKKRTKIKLKTRHKQKPSKRIKKGKKSKRARRR